MIIDFRTDERNADRYDVVDRQTGQSLNHLPIWYADDDGGFYRAWVPGTS